MWVRICWVFAFVSLLIAAQGQPDIRTFKRLGDQYYAAERYQDAINAYQQYFESITHDPQVSLRLGASYLETNNLAAAEQHLTDALRFVNSVDVSVHLYWGRLHHQRLEFQEAITFYKDYLRQIDLTHPNRETVKDDILRCATGIRLSNRQNAVRIHNLGPGVNSVYDDFRPIPSPLSSNRIYFSSNREGTVGGRKVDPVPYDPSWSPFNTDMFFTTLMDEEWQEATPMSYLLNSPRHDVVLDFSDDGQRFFFFKGFSLYSGQIFVDTFRTQLEERTLFSDLFSGPVQSEQGDCDPHFFRDTILLFASRREGGFGGLDLYISTFRNESWSTPENLGPSINTPYDERAPFLARDGRTLYYSTNDPRRSIGGMDIMRAVFDDQEEKWKELLNMGLPVNSPADDLYFRLMRDGYQAVFSSRRKASLGGNDLYVATFREYRAEQRKTSVPLVFNEVSEYKKIRDRKGRMLGKPAVYREEVLAKYLLEPVYYDADGGVIIEQNANNLQRLLEMMLEFPQLELILTSHSDGAARKKLELFASLKKGERVVDFLIQRGIDPGRIFLSAVGDTYPIAKMEEDGRSVQEGRIYNRRIDIQIGNTAGLPLRVRVKEPEVPQKLEQRSFSYFARMTRGLYYKVQIIEIGQMYAGSLIFSYPHAMIERLGRDDQYKYTLGLYQTFISAEQLRKDLEQNGVLGTKVIPYIGGRRLRAEEVRNYVSTYPDLENYLEQQ